jgi:hypothetical protein
MTINQSNKKVGFMNSVLHIDSEGEKYVIFLNAIRLCI